LPGKRVEAYRAGITAKTFGDAEFAINSTTASLMTP
jgi:hypothetical protein